MSRPGIKTQSLTAYEENVLLHAEVQFILTGNESYDRKILQLMRLGLSELCATSLVKTAIRHTNSQVYRG